MLFATFVVVAEDQTQAILLGYYFANVLALPIWVKLAGRFGKKGNLVSRRRSVCSGHTVLFATGCERSRLVLFDSFFIRHRGRQFWRAVDVYKADVIELAARRSGENVAVAYIAAWSLGQNFVMALSLLLALQSLEATGFDAYGNNGPDELRALSLVYVLPPWLFRRLVLNACALRLTVEQPDSNKTPTVIF